MVEAGYKYICWDLGEDNADIYMNRIQTGKPIHHSELTECKGMYDKENMPGIYFCESLDDLYVWLKELFDFANPAAIELIKVQAIGDVKHRYYENGRIAYVAPSASCRVLLDSELTPEILTLLSEFFDWSVA